MTEITQTPPHANLQVTDQAGQLACFNCVIETYQTQAYNLARRMLSDWALAEDALQESFVSAYRAFNRLRGEDLAAWVLRIVSNTCRDMLQARKSRPTVSLDPVPDLITEIKGESSSHGPRHLNLTRRTPYGVVAKINAFNHPFRFCAEKAHGFQSDCDSSSSPD